MFNRKNKKSNNKQRWYYDACVLDHDKNIYSYIINKDDIRENIISHLALGEAYGNCCIKGLDQAEAFAELIRTLHKYIKIVGNEVKDNIFEKVRRQFPNLKIPDATHLATALENKCDILLSADCDLCNLDKNKVIELAKDCNGDCGHIKIKAPE